VSRLPAAEELAAVIAAVEAYLADERKDKYLDAPTRGISAWRMAYAPPGAHVRAWRGRGF